MRRVANLTETEATITSKNDDNDDDEDIDLDESEYESSDDIFETGGIPIIGGKYRG